MNIRRTFSQMCDSAKGGKCKGVDEIRRGVRVRVWGWILGLYARGSSYHPNVKSTHPSINHVCQ